MINLEDGATTMLTTEEFSDLSRYMSKEDFQALVLDAMRKQSARIIILEQVADKAVKELKRLDRELADHRELITKIRRKVFPDASQATPEGPVN
jgi:GH25 family lysozyme M1 (1,4-beta-N-acetylmuramidase)